MTARNHLRDLIETVTICDDRKPLPRRARALVTEDDLLERRDPVRDAVVKVLEGAELEAGQVAARALIPEHAVERALVVLRLSGRVEKVSTSNSRVTWRIAA